MIVCVRGQPNTTGGLKNIMSEVYVKVRPESGKIEVDTNSAIIRIDLTEPAENGKANAQLLKFLEEQTGEEAAIISGHRSRRKKVKIDVGEKKLRELLQR